MLQTPPSKGNHSAKYLMANSTNAGVGMFTCTPKDELIKTNKKDDIKATTMFSTSQGTTLGGAISQARCNMLMQTPPY